MSHPPSAPVSVASPSLTAAIRRWGTSAWNLVGIVVVAAVGLGIAGALSGVLVPLTIATVVGIIASPLVDLMQRRRVPRPVGALIVMVVLIALVVGAILASVRGVVDQSDEIVDQLSAGIGEVNLWLAERNPDASLGDPDGVVTDVGAVGRRAVGGLASYASTIFSSVVAFLVGGFLSLFFLYYVLADWHRLSLWVGRSLGVPHDLGAGIVDDVTRLVRRGFVALTLSSLVTAVLIGGTMVILDLPLAFTVAFVTFVTSYIPYLGAIFSGAFGFLVALGASGLTDALILLAVILVVQNVVQTLVGNRLVSTSLALHPIAALVSTIVGAVIAGLLGAMLSAPVLAAIIAVRRRIRDYGRVVGDGSAPAPVPGEIAIGALVTSEIGGVRT